MVNMIKINLLVVGKVKEKYFADGISEYSKRLSRFCDFNIIEVQEENYSKADEGSIKLIKEREAERLKPYLKGYVVALAIEGKKYSSESFAKLLGGLIDKGQGVITFVSGGSYGLLESIKQSSNALISFSDMTCPHTMFRLMFTEQIYRAFCIINGSAYHK